MMSEIWICIVCSSENLESSVSCCISCQSLRRHSISSKSGVTLKSIKSLNVLDNNDYDYDNENNYENINNDDNDNIIINNKNNYIISDIKIQEKQITSSPSSSSPSSSLRRSSKIMKQNDIIINNDINDDDDDDNNNNDDDNNDDNNSITHQEQINRMRGEQLTLTKKFQDQQELIVSLKRQVQDQQQLIEILKPLKGNQMTRQRQQCKLLNRPLSKEYDFSLVTDFLTIVERIRLEKCSTYLFGELFQSKYWRCIDINFDESKLYHLKSGFIWRLLCTRKARLDSVTITLGSKEADVIKSLLSRCDCTNLRTLHIYKASISPLSDFQYYFLLGTVYPGSTCDVTRNKYCNRMVLDSVTELLKIDKSFRPNTDRSLYSSLVKSSKLRDLRVYCTTVEEALMIQYFETLKCLTVIIRPKAEENYVNILLRVINSVQRLPSLRTLELLSVQFVETTVTTSTLIVVKSPTLKRLTINLASGTYIYNINCPLLKRVEVNDKNHLKLPLHFRDLNFLINEGDNNDSLPEDWTLVEVNNEMGTKASDFFGVHVDRVLNICYVNHIKLPRGCKFVGNNSDDNDHLTDDE